MKTAPRRAWWPAACAVVLGLLGPAAQAGPSTQAKQSPEVAAHARDVAAWLERLHLAASRSTYTGTFVVSSGPDISASRIWHVCDDRQQVERIERLTGSPRITWRRNDEVVTLSPEDRVATWERRDGLGRFPNFPEQPGRQIGDFYEARVVGRERVAGLDADVVEFQPRDPLRFGHRIWSARASGLALRWQTRAVSGEVLEQASFTDLLLNAPLSTERLARQMAVPAGYQTVRPTLTRISPQAQGWRIREGVPGFLPTNCQMGGGGTTNEPAPLQCILSDGLASVSLFIEPYDPARHAREGQAVRGATHSISRRLNDSWVTAVGEVPTETLKRLSLSLEPAR